jgi:inhibitor of cysteine peptidase
LNSSQTEQRSSRVGELFTIRLQANPSTGFAWQAIFDPTAVALVDRAFEPRSQAIGAGGEEVLTFKPLRAGRATITLDLRRPWEKGARESRAYDILVEP